MRTLAAIAVCLAALAAQGAQPSVAVDLSGLDEPAFRQLDAVTLEKNAAVVLPSAQPDVLLRVTVARKPRRVALHARGPTGASLREVP